MKISSIYPQPKAEKVQPKKGDEALSVNRSGEARPAAGDRVELSTNSMDVQKIKEIIKETPPVREDRVADIKARIERGEYRIDSRAVAGKMLMSLLTDIPSR